MKTILSVRAAMSAIKSLIAIATLFVALANGTVHAATEVAWPDWLKPETKYIIADFIQRRQLTPLALARGASNATWGDVDLVPWVGEDWGNTSYPLLDAGGNFGGRVNLRFRTSFLESVSVRGVVVVTVDFAKRGTSVAPSSFTLQQKLQLQLFALRLLFERPVDPNADSVPVPSMNSLLLLDASQPSTSSGGRLAPGRIWHENDASTPAATIIRHQPEIAGYSDVGGERVLNLDVHLTACGAVTFTTLRNNAAAPNQVIQVRGPNSEFYPDAASGRDPWIFPPGTFRVSTDGRAWTTIQVVAGAHTPVSLVVR